MVVIVGGGARGIPGVVRVATRPGRDPLHARRRTTSAHTLVPTPGKGLRNAIGPLHRIRTTTVMVLLVVLGKGQRVLEGVSCLSG